MTSALERQVGAVVGAPGYGKTVLTSQVIAGHRRVLILQPWTHKNEYKAQRVTSYAALFGFLMRHGHGPFTVTYTPHPAEVPYIYMLVWALQMDSLKRHGGTPDPILMVLEEATTYMVKATKNADGTWIYRKGVTPDEFTHLTERGRHLQVSIILTTQRPFNLPLDLRATLDWVMAFHLPLKHDRAWFQDFAPSVPGLGDELLPLPKLRFRKVTQGGIVTNGEIQF
ncbi:MAG: hypothetical protein HYZ75_00825 [Elusimicrobia bacterium]|nr:hypothetical protein [Elusimicrobiota bacterium]